MRFRITVRKDGLPEQERVVEAPSRFDVYRQVSAEGGFVASIEEAHGFSLLALSRLNISIGTGIKRIEVIRLAKNLSAMLNAGLSISRALSVIERQSSNKRLKKVATGLSESVKKGSSFHEAVAEYPGVFSELFVAMARSGEESGSLADSLAVVGTQMEHAEELVRKIRGAMIYPAIVIVAVVIVTILMLIYVVQTLTATFEALNVELPLSTRVIVALSNFMVGNAVITLAAFILAFLGILLFVRLRLGRRAILAVALCLPLAG